MATFISLEACVFPPLQELFLWQTRLDASVAKCRGTLETTKGLLESETGRLRADMAVVAAAADARVRASADAVSAAIAAAPKVCPLRIRLWKVTETPVR